MRVLIIDAQVKAEIEIVVTYANANRVSLARAKRMTAIPPLEPPIGDTSGYVVQVPNGYRCAFSIEEQEQPIGWCRHLSISVDARPGVLPSPQSVAMLMREFGFSQDASALVLGILLHPERAMHAPAVMMWLEERRAVNVVEQMS